MWSRNKDIAIEREEETLTIRIPGRFMPQFWLLTLIFCGAVGTMAFLVHSEPAAREPGNIVLIAIVFLILLVYLLATRPREETIILDPYEITVSGSGSVFPWNNRRMPTAKLQYFAVKPVGIVHVMHSSVILMFDVAMLRDKGTNFLFACSDEVDAKKEKRANWALRTPFYPFPSDRYEGRAYMRHEADREILLAVQAKEKDLPRLQEILSEHLDRIRKPEIQTQAETEDG